MSLFTCLFFIMCTLHQTIPFYILFPFMCFKQCFMKVFMIFSWFEVWYISPLNTRKQKGLGFKIIQGRKYQTSNQEKIGGNSLLLSYFFFFFWEKSWYDTMYNFQIYIFLNACNLGHSNTHNLYKYLFWLVFDMKGSTLRMLLNKKRIVFYFFIASPLVVWWKILNILTNHFLFYEKQAK